MAFGKKSLQSLEDEPDGDESAEPEQKDTKLSGPPPAKPSPRSASDSSLFSTAGRAGMEESKAGLGPEGSDPNIIGMQGLALVQRGIQMLNMSFPDNPGLVAILADLTGRLQTIIPQLVAGSTNGGMGLFGGMAGGMGMPPGMPPGGMPGMPPPGGPPGMGGPPMGPAMAPPIAGSPQGPPGPMPPQMPPVPPGR